MHRIGIVCGAGTVSGKEIMVMELADGLRERGYSVSLVTARWGRAEFAEHFRAQGSPVLVTWLGFIAMNLRWDCLYMTAVQLFRLPQLWLDYRRYLRATRPEKMIHTNWQHSLLLFFFLKPERDLFWLHEVIPDKPQYQRVFGWLASRFGLIVCVSAAVAESLRSIGVPPEKVRVVHNGVTDPAGPGSPTREDALSAQRVGIVGQIGRWKGHEDLFTAFGLLLKDFPKAELHVFGRSQDEFEEELRRRSDSPELKGKIIWHGFVTDRAAIFHGMDVCVVPSRFVEPFGLVAVEAGFFGVPVVASRRGGLPEIVEDGGTGFLFEAENVAELAATLRKLLGDERLRREMGTRARRHVREKFGRERLVGDFVRVFNQAKICSPHPG